VWVVLFLQLLSAPAAQLSLICLQLGIFCFIVKDFLTAREENIRQDERSEQELPMPLGTSSVSSKVSPAVEIQVSTLLGIKEYPLG